MTFKSPGKLRIPQWSTVTRLLTAEDVTLNEFGVVTNRVRTDFTGGIVYCTVRDDNGVIVIQKDSTDSSQIEVLDQLVAATQGQARIKFIYVDTAPLSNDPRVKYWFDAWVWTADNRREPIIDRGRFYVDRSSTNIPEGPTPNLPTFPASQSQQTRSFKWTAPATGDVFTVTIPGVGMVDDTYTVAAMYSNIPAGGSWAGMYAPELARTQTTFELQTTAPILVGTVVDILVRDV